MKNLILLAVFLVTGVFTSLSAQYYTNYNTTYKTSYPKAYTSYQTYVTPKSYSNVSTHRSYNRNGGYTSSTYSYGSKGLKSSSYTTYSPYSGYSTVKYNYRTGSTTFKYSAPRTKIRW